MAGRTQENLEELRRYCDSMAGRKEPGGWKHLKPGEEIRTFLDECWVILVHLRFALKALLDRAASEEDVQ